MKTYIAFLRGINVGGHKKIPMKELRDLFLKMKLNNVQTYIQSGNVVFQSEENNIKTLKLKIEKNISSCFGFDVPVLIKTYAELKTIYNECPLSKEKKERSYFMLLYTEPNQDLIEKLAVINSQDEEFYITKNCVYFYSNVGYGRTKYNNNFFEKKLKVTATARNYKTLLKLLSLCKDLN